MQIAEDVTRPTTTQSGCHVQTRFADVHSGSSFTTLSYQQRRQTKSFKFCIGGGNLKPLGLSKSVKWKASTIASLKVLKTRLSWKKAKSYHDRPAHPLPPLVVGQEVRLVPLKKAKNWQPGSPIQPLSDMSYLVKTQNETMDTIISQRKNQQQISFRKWVLTLPKKCLLQLPLMEKETVQKYMNQHPIP